MAAPLKVFLSYSHKDREQKALFESHFSSLERTKDITLWSDERLDAGDLWDEIIQQKLNNADLVILLVSANFISSDYIYYKELTVAIRENRKAVIIPVLLSNTSLTDTPLAALQSLPAGPRFIDKWDNNADAWVNVIEGVRKTLTKMEEERKTWDPVSAREVILDLLKQPRKLEEACCKAIDFVVNYGDKVWEFEVEAITIRTKLSDLEDAESRKKDAIPPPPTFGEVLDYKQKIRMEIYRLVNKIFGNLSNQATG
jgi:hypothetical protein